VEALEVLVRLTSDFAYSEGQCKNLQFLRIRLMGLSEFDGPPKCPTTLLMGLEGLLKAFWRPLEGPNNTFDGFLPAC
jgi:hypothetical protein